ncbi:MAG: cupin domain-containing protein [Candidatus Bipolaricaulia bacterium]
MKKIVLAEQPVEMLNPNVSRKLVRGERLEFIEYRYRGGARFPVHTHPSEQLTIVVRGRLTFTTPGATELTLEAGEAVLIPPNEPHGAFVPEEVEGTVTYNVFTPVRTELPGG